MLTNNLHFTMDYMYYCLAFFLSSFLVFKLVFQRTILKWVGYKVEEESVIKVFKERDEFLQGLIEEVKRKETSSVTSNPAEGVKDQITVIGSLLALQKSDPELYTDEVVKGTMANYLYFEMNSKCTLLWKSIHP
ncbi:hypothetical protein D5086_030056 [Populus alba]|uniref:Uncharacterized protein n=1 Tax=Populus alba TaxID=43335 RepID=A0ACC4AMK2_POPAL